MKVFILLFFLVPTISFAQSIESTTTIISTTRPTIAETEQQVRTFFSDLPVMIDIARCESRFRQFADSGNVFRGGTNSKMIGIFQIYEDVHKSFAMSLGMDISTVSGNMSYARYLYQKEKTNPWISSMPCWNANPVPEQISTPTQSSALTTNLIFGMVHPEVQTLQQILNKLGFVITSEGPGSPGNETTKFGSLTRVALRNFQCAQNIVCSGDEYTTAYGLVGPRTREALSKVISVSTSTATVNTAEINRIAGIKAQIEQLKKQIADLQSQIPQ